MKKTTYIISGAIVGALTLLLIGATSNMLIRFGKLQTDLDANSQSITNLNTLVFYSGSIPNPFSVYTSDGTNVANWFDIRSWAYNIVDQFSWSPTSTQPSSGGILPNNATGSSGLIGDATPTGLSGVDWLRLSVSNSASAYSACVWRAGNGAIDYVWTGNVFFETRSVVDSLGSTVVTNEILVCGIANTYAAVPARGVFWLARDEFSPNWIAACGVANTFSYSTSTIPITTAAALSFVGNTNGIVFSTNHVAFWTNTANLCGGSSTVPTLSNIHVSATDQGTRSVIENGWVDYVMCYMK